MQITTSNGRARIKIGQIFDFDMLLKHKGAVLNSFPFLSSIFKRYKKLAKESEKLLRNHLATHALPVGIYLNNQEIIKEVFPETIEHFDKVGQLPLPRG